VQQRETSLKICSTPSRLMLPSILTIDGIDKRLISIPCTFRRQGFDRSQWRPGTRREVPESEYSRRLELGQQIEAVVATPFCRQRSMQLLHKCCIGPSGLQRTKLDSQSCKRMARQISQSASSRYVMLLSEYSATNFACVLLVSDVPLVGK
jgi:hypothetical protein